MTRRREILEEMGLGPVWRLRARADRRDEPAATQPSQSDTVVEPGAIRSRAAQTIEGAMSADAAPGDAPDRRAAILRMDWAALEASVAACVACPLHARRTNTVFGVGDKQADWLFVGEGPGAEEDARGEPFVGQAGRLLDNMLTAIDLARGEDVYIANVVKCRPPGNRNPEAEEMLCCEPYLTRQIELIAPKLIVAMGRIAATHLLSTNASIASLRGRVHDYRGTPLIVTYHPAYLLRNLPDKAKSWSDLCFARVTMQALK